MERIAEKRERDKGLTGPGDRKLEGPMVTRAGWQGAVRPRDSCED